MQLQELGPAVLGFPLVGAAIADGVLVVSSRNLEPAHLGLYDLTSRTVVGEVTVPTGLGAWGMAPDRRGGVLVGQFGAQAGDSLYRLDVATRALEPLAALPHVYVWALASARDGFAAGVLDQPAAAFIMAPDGRTSTLPAALAGPGDTPRAVTVAGEHVVVGGSNGRRAFLRAAARDGGGVRDVLPPDLTEDGIVYTLASGLGIVVAGTRGPGEREPAVAVLAAHDLHVGQLVRIPGESVVDAIAITVDAVWVTTRPSGMVHRIDRLTSAVTPAGAPMPGDEHRGLFARGSGREPDDLVGVAAGGAVWHLDPATGATEVRDLVADGLVDGAPERTQSLAAGDGHVWAGGTFGLAELDIAAGQRSRRWVPGEPKALVVVGDDLYLAVYPVGQVWHLPAGGDIELLAQLPAGENRPLSIAYEPTRDVLLVGTAADREGGGGFHVLERATGALQSQRNPIDASQRVLSVVAVDGLAVLGGTVDGQLVVVDIDEDHEVWRPDPLPDAGAVRGLVAHGDLVWSFTTAGWLQGIDPAAGTVARAERITPAGGGLVAVGAHLYGVDADHLYRIDPASLTVETLLDGLGSVLWGHPFLAADEHGRLYVLRGTDVVQIEL